MLSRSRLFATLLLCSQESPVIETSAFQKEMVLLMASAKKLVKISSVKMNQASGVL